MQLTDNELIERALGQYGIICMEVRPFFTIYILSQADTISRTWFTKSTLLVPISNRLQTFYGPSSWAILPVASVHASSSISLRVETWEIGRSISMLWFDRWTRFSGDYIAVAGGSISIPALRSPSIQALSGQSYNEIGRMRYWPHSRQPSPIFFPWIEPTSMLKLRSISNFL